MSTVYAEAKQASTIAVRSIEVSTKQLLPVPAQSPSAGSLFTTGAAKRSEAGYGQFKNWVYGAVNAVAKRLAAQPIIVATRARQGGRRDRRGVARVKAYPPSVAKHALMGDMEMLAEHPILDGVGTPNHVQGKFEFLYCSAVNLLVTGEAYWIYGLVDDPNEEDPDRQRLEAWAVPTTWIKVSHADGLFSGFGLQTPGMHQPEPLDPGTVARTYLPDPSDLRKAQSPITSILPAVKVDESIQQSQQNMFERGINPNVMVTVGRARGPDGKLSDRRPRLTGQQRDQIIRAVREIWRRSVNDGDPAVIDGLIESVHKLQMTPQEMDWLASGETVKKRIMQAYSVNPISLGEVSGSNRAQATEAERQICTQAVNPLVDAFSQTLNRVLPPIYEDGDELMVFIQECEPKDPELEDRRWANARRNGDVTADEYRTNVLDMPPTGLPERSQLLNTVGGMTGTVTVLTNLGQGLITRDQAKNTLMVFLQITDEEAEAIAGDSTAALPAPAAEPAEPEPEPEDDASEIDDQLTDEANAASSRSTKSTDKTNLRKIIHARHIKRLSQVESFAADKLQSHFSGILEQVAKAVGKQRTFSATPEAAQQQAEQLIADALDVEQANEELGALAAEVLPAIFAVGAQAEVELTRSVAVIKSRPSGASKQTTAEEIAERLEIEVPPGISIGPMPEWMLQAAREVALETFSQEYWQRIHETTRDDILRTLVRSIEQGWSVRRIAREIRQTHGEQYSKARATNVARTETGNMLNAGHQAGMRQIQEELSMPIGKEWLSVLGNTTRPEHAALNGVTTDTADGLFDLDGTLVPWPSHHSLEAAQRCNCQCTILSSFVLE